MVSFYPFEDMRAASVIYDARKESVELEEVMTKILEHSLEIGKLLKLVNKKEYMRVNIETHSPGWRSEDTINVELDDDTVHRILSGTHTRAMNFCELNCYLQKKFGVEYEHKVYHTYSK